MFLDGPDAKAREAIHSIFAAENVEADYLASAPDVFETDHDGPFQIVDLEPLV